ncbi:MAG: DUF4421 domain-containing protein [Paramuribaculum sp.]|nr:DUF4421 domain-containing protein [Paramuribaculum sp.]
MPDLYAASTDSIPVDSVKYSSTAWIKQLIDNGGKINDPEIHYPKFPKFVVNVYNWGDRVFNSYDTTYVTGTGKNWKLMLRSRAWLESYMFMFSVHTRDLLGIRSEIYDNVGVSLSFMAISLSATTSLKKLFTGKTSTRNHFNFNFTCSRLYGNIDVTSTHGDSKIIHFGNYMGGGLISYPFDAIKHNAINAQIYYFFNHMKYSQAAAYCFSKYQLKSAGSAILGVSVSHQSIEMDFSSLPADMKAFLPSLQNDYDFRYTDYCIAGGYGYNWAIRPRTWLINGTLLQSLGYRHDYQTTGKSGYDAVAANLMFRCALVYNHRALYASLAGEIDANFYYNGNYMFTNAVGEMSLAVGVRF